MAFDKEKLRSIYRKRAKRYDLTANLYYLVGFRENAIRYAAVDALKLKDGDTVLELGCGTGLNFSIIKNKTGRTGKIIGVDFSPEMISQARNRIARHGWDNIQLVQSDIGEFKIPKSTTSILSTFAITLTPEYDDVIKKCAASLSKKGTLAIADFKEPAHWPRFLLNVWLAVTRPFGVTLDLAKRHPWESIERSFSRVYYREFYFGLAYVCSGTFEQQEHR